MIESSAAMRRPISLLSFACLVLMTAPALRTDAAPTEGRPPSVPEPPAPQRLVAERLCWRTADADYPRVRLHPQRTAPGWLHLEVCFGRYAASDAALTNRPVKVRHRDIAAGDRRAPCCHPDVIAFVAGRIDTLQQDLAHYERIKRFVLLPDPFTIDNGELTNTLKVKRRVVYERYAEVIAGIYSDPKAPHVGDVREPD